MIDHEIAERTRLDRIYIVRNHTLP
jgi:hypothetical protein